MHTLLLRCLVHLEALVARPAAYLQAVGWRVRRLKLRARHRFSALMGHTRHAYSLWIASREPLLQTAIVANKDEALAFVLVIDCRQGGHAALCATLNSIAAAKGPVPKVLFLGADPTAYPDYDCVADPAELVTRLRQGFGSAEPCWIIPITSGDRLAPVALEAYRQAITAAPDAVLLYADDDLIGLDGRRQAPHFKSGWNAELFGGHDFISGSCAFAAHAVSLEQGIPENWPRDALPLNVAVPLHIAHVLHHRRTRPAPLRLGALPPVILATALPHVSVIVPTRDQVMLLRTCMAGLAQTDYPALDVTVIDNGSRDRETLSYFEELRGAGVRIVPYPGPFNYAAMHNAIVPSLRGPLLCLLNNDIEIIDLQWLAQMVPHALRDDIGAVGARLLYPDRTIQHAGIVIGVGGGAGHAHRLQRDDATGYFGRAHLPQRISAVTAACLVVRKNRFEAVGGFDAGNFTVAFNDVDLCLKLNAAGWQSFYEPRACLIHHESKSRGRDTRGPKRARFAAELAALKRLWSTDRIQDPFHHPELSQFTEQFVVRL